MPKSVRYYGGIAAVVLLMIAPQSHGAATVDAEKHAKIEALLEDTGMLENTNRIIDLLVPKIINNFRAMNKKVPDPIWDEFTRIGIEEMKRALPELKEPIIAIYDANFSTDEISQLAAFYHSPVGRKIQAQLPQIVQQIATMGQSWGEQAGARAVERIRAEAKQKGYNL